MTRQGLNSTLSYTYGDTTMAFRARCIGVNHQVVQVSDESHARVARAFYPHRRSTGPFVITLGFKGTAERSVFVDWLNAYAVYMTNPSTDPVVDITVSVPSRNFLRRGVPVSGFPYGEHIGSIYWEVPVAFQTTHEPWDPSQVPVSSVLNAPNIEGYRENQFFYPTGTQLGGNQAPPQGTYPSNTVGDTVQQLLGNKTVMTDLGNYAGATPTSGAAEISQINSNVDWSTYGN
jgi:hypothetical protein